MDMEKAKKETKVADDPTAGLQPQPNFGTPYLDKIIKIEEEPTDGHEQGD